MREGKEREALALDAALAVPALAWLCAAAVVLGATLGGYRALAAPTDLTIAEAAALRDEAQVLKEIRAGVDPGVPARIRRGIVGDEEYLVTPFEAAIANRHLEIVELLVRNGVSLDLVQMSTLLCLARAAGATDIISFLEARRPAATDVRCEGVRLPW